MLTLCGSEFTPRIPFRYKFMSIVMYSSECKEFIWTINRDVSVWFLPQRSHLYVFLAKFQHLHVQR